MGGLFCLGEGVRISRSWGTIHFLDFLVSLRTVMVPVGVSFSILIMYCNEHIMSLKVHQQWNLPPS